MRTMPPWLALFLLAPAIGELLSSSSPPKEFFNPLTFLVLSVLYGGGALLVREAALSSGSGYRAILLLGAAYGILEEGVAVKSFYDPHWVDLGILGGYGRWWGVNWVWSLELTVFHAIFSITIPIVLVHIAYPDHREKRWVEKKWRLIILFLLVADVALIAFGLNPYWPPAPQYALSFCGIATLAVAARTVASGRGERRLPSPRLLFFSGFASTVAFFLVFWSAPHFIPNPLLVMAAGCLLIFAILHNLAAFDWSASSDDHLFALASGALLFFILLAPLTELDAARVDDTTGMTIVGMAFLALLYRVRKKLWG